MRRFKMLATTAVSFAFASFCFSFAGADNAFAPMCPRIMNMAAPVRFSEGQMRIAMKALEKEGYRITIKLFQKHDPVANHILQKALGLSGITVNENMYDNLPVRESIPAYRNRLISTPPPEAARPRAPTRTRRNEFQVPEYRDALFQSVHGDDVAEMRETQKDYLMNILKYMDRHGKRTNVSAIAREIDAEAVFQAVTIGYSGSLYDALVDAGLNPSTELSFAENTNVDHWLNHFRTFAKPISSPRLLADLAEAVAMEYPLRDTYVVRALLNAIVDTTFTKPEDLARVAAESLRRRLMTDVEEDVTVDRVSELLRSFTRNRTLFDFDEALQSQAEQESRFEQVRRFIEGEL